MLHKTTIALLIAALAVPVAACGEEEAPPQTAAEFCAEHGGINDETYEADGDVACMDGAEYEGDGDSAEEEESSDEKKKRKKR